jgi:endogenous inhibitor of DNA gyrase (YacG/DUF329 family)
MIRVHCPTCGVVWRPGGAEAASRLRAEFGKIIGRCAECHKKVVRQEVEHQKWAKHA